MTDSIPENSRLCNSCVKVTVCAPYRSAKSFETGFNEEFTDITKTSPAELLAQQCTQYESPQANGKYSKLNTAELEIITTAVKLAHGHNDIQESELSMSVLKMAQAEQARRKAKELTV